MTLISNRAAQKYNILTKAIVSGDLVEPLCQMSQTEWLPQWKSNFFRCQRWPHVLTEAAMANNSFHTMSFAQSLEDQRACSHLPDQ